MTAKEQLLAKGFGNGAEFLREGELGVILEWEGDFAIVEWGIGNFFKLPADEFLKHINEFELYDTEKIK